MKDSCLFCWLDFLVGEWTKFIFNKNELIVGFVLTALSVK